MTGRQVVSQSDTDEIVAAARALLIDIEEMRDGLRGQYWYGSFSEWASDDSSDYGKMSVEWPCLAISADRLRTAIAGLK